MTTQIEFFTDPELSDISKVRIYDSPQKQKDYFDSLTKVTVTGAFKGFDEPILIYEDIAVAIGHAYGRFKISDKYYYFYVTDVRQDTPGKSWVYYRLDHWETVREQFGITLGRGYVSRSSLVEPCAVPYNAKYHKHIKHVHLSHRSITYNVIPDVVFFARRHDSNECRIGYISGPFLDNELRRFLNGDWVEYIMPTVEDPDTHDQVPYFNASDVIGAWFTPPLIDVSQDRIRTGWEKLAGRDGHFVNKTIISVFPTDSSEVLGFGNLTYSMDASIVKQYFTDNTKTAVVKDLEGNIIYQFDYGREYDTDLEFRLSVSPTAAKWLVSTEKIYERHEPINFTFPCSNLDMFIESYAEYFARDRQFDIESRNLSNKKDLSSSVVSGGAGALAGAAEGALVGSVVPGVGTAVGAVLGAVGGGIAGLITGGADYGLNQYYNPQEQQIKDNYYKNAVDPLAIVGSNLFTFLYDGSKHCGIFHYEVDPDTKDRIESDIENYGQYTAKATDNGESYLADDAKLKGDFIINGNIPENWKAAIQQRFSSGVHIIKRGG